MDYIKNLFNSIPLYVYWSLFISICVVSAIIIKTRKRNDSFRLIVRILLIAYSFLVFCSTFLFRPVKENMFCHVKPFWNYSLICQNKTVLPEIVMNVLIYMPIGALLYFVLNKRKWWKPLAVGIVMSVVLEMLQYKYSCGYGELDDVMHNTIGCVLGYGLVLLSVKYACQR